MFMQQIASMATTGFLPEFIAAKPGLAAVSQLYSSSFDVLKASGTAEALNGLTTSGPMAGAARFFQDGAFAVEHFAGRLPGLDAVASLDMGTLGISAVLLAGGLAGGYVLLRSFATAAANWLEKGGQGNDRNSVWQAPVASMASVVAKPGSEPKSSSLYEAQLALLIDPRNIAPYPGHEDEAALPLRERARRDAEVLTADIDGARGILIRLRYNATRDCARRDAKIIAELAESPLQDEQLRALEKMQTQGELVQRLAYFATVFAEYARLNPIAAPVYRKVVADIMAIERDHADALEKLGWDELSEKWGEMVLLHTRIALARTPQDIELVLNTTNAGDIVTRPE